MEFGSDNNAGTAPAILDAVVACNAGPAPSYGNDPINWGASGYWGTPGAANLPLDPTAPTVPPPRAAYPATGRESASLPIGPTEPARGRWPRQSATASVMIMVGALAEAGVRRIPSQPAAPMAVIIESMMTSMVASVPHT